MSIFRRRPTRADCLLEALERIELADSVGDPESQNHIYEETLPSIEELLNESIISDAYRDTKLPEELRARGEALLARIKQQLSDKAAATPPTQRDRWPATEDRLQPCSNCGCQEHLVIEEACINELSAGGYLTRSPSLDMAFCRGCGRVSFYGHDLKQVKDFVAKPTVMQAQLKSTPYRS